MASNSKKKPPTSIIPGDDARRWREGASTRRDAEIRTGRVAFFRKMSRTRFFFFGGGSTVPGFGGGGAGFAGAGAGTGVDGTSMTVESAAFGGAS